MNKFGYLNLNNIEGGWNELYRDIPEWISEIRKDIYKPLDKKTELNLAEIAKNGSGREKVKARETVINCNLRFVANIARHYLHRDIDTAELIAVGNEALVLAFDKFDPSRNVKFITYAVNIIRAKMIELLRNISIIKLSASNVRLLNDYITFGDVELIKEMFPHKYKDSIEELEIKLNNCLNIRYVTSIDKECENGFKKSDTLVADDVSFLNDKDQILEILETSNLNKQEKEIIYLNFGIDTDSSLGLRKIAKKFNSNLSAIAKIRNKALKKLRLDSRFLDIFNNLNKSNTIKYAYSKHSMSD